MSCDCLTGEDRKLYLYDLSMRGYLFGLQCREHSDEEVFLVIEDVERHPEWKRANELKLVPDLLMTKGGAVCYLMYQIPMDYKTWLNARATDRAIATILSGQSAFPSSSADTHA